MSAETISEAYPLIPSDDVGGLAHWLVHTLDLKESWRNVEEGRVAHAEVVWPGGRVSINRLKPGETAGSAQVALRVDDRDRVSELYARAKAAGADIIMEPVETRVAYSFTTRDNEGNHWWVNAETGFLDELRTIDPSSGERL